MKSSATTAASSDVAKQASSSNSGGGGGGGALNAWSKPLPKPTAVPSKQQGPPPGLSLPNSNNNSGNEESGVASNNTVSPSTLLALRERYLHVLLALTGQTVTVTLVSGAVHKGVLHTSTPFAHLPAHQRCKYVLKQAVTEVEGSHGKDAVKVQPGSTVLLDMAQVVQLVVKSCRLDALPQHGGTKSAATTNGGAGFNTDTEISQARTAHAKELVKADASWTSATNHPHNSTQPPHSRAMGAAAAQGALGDGGKGIAGWDQFKANEQLFDVKGDYDEAVYTTVLDTQQVPASARRKAERLAQEIQSSVSTNMHVAEERGQAILGDYDEEDRYSGVLTSGGSGKTATGAGTPGGKGKPGAPTRAALFAEAVAAKPDSVSKPSKGPSGAVSSSAPKLNYAQAAAARADKNKQTTPPPAAAAADGDVVKEGATKKESGTTKQTTTPTTSEAKVETTATAKADTEKAKDKPEKELTKAVSKLNVNAKSFSFNIGAKPFTPTSASTPTAGGTPQSQQQQPPPPPPPHPPQYIDPATGMPLMMPHMHGLQPGMMPMMNPQYPGLRYPVHYPGMDQRMQPHPSQAMPGQPPGAPPNPTPETHPATAAAASDDGSPSQPPVPADGDAPTEAAQQPPVPSATPHGAPHGVPASYMQQQQQQQQSAAQQQQQSPQPQQHAPPTGYYPGQMMHHPQQFMHPHMAAAAAHHMQRQMYAPHMQPPPMMRGPVPYYPNGQAMPYGPYGNGYEEDPSNGNTVGNNNGGNHNTNNNNNNGNNYGGRGGRGGRGGNGRGGGQGRGRNNGRGNNGRGRGGGRPYNNNNNHHPGGSHSFNHSASNNNNNNNHTAPATTAPAVPRPAESSSNDATPAVDPAPSTPPSN